MSINSKHVRIAIYLEPEQSNGLKLAAQRRGKTVSRLIRDMLSKGELRPMDREDYLRLGMNTLLKYHPNENLLSLVEREWAARKVRSNG